MGQGAETEIKLRVHNLPALRRRLSNLKFRKVQSRHFESNILLDFPDRSLWRARCLLRLRRADGCWLVTFKGVPLTSRTYKTRREIETTVEDGARLKEILEAVGLRPAFRYEKYRTAYAPGARVRKTGAPLLLLDETPIGNFLELEGPKRWINRVATQLGFRRRDYITASYASLYRKKCLQHRVEPTNMVFSQAKS